MLYSFLASIVISAGQRKCCYIISTIKNYVKANIFSIFFNKCITNIKLLLSNTECSVLLPFFNIYFCFKRERDILFSYKYNDQDLARPNAGVRSYMWVSHISTWAIVYCFSWVTTQDWNLYWSSQICTNFCEGFQCVTWGITLYASTLTQYYILLG